MKHQPKAASVGGKESRRQIERSPFRRWPCDNPFDLVILTHFCIPAKGMVGQDALHYLVVISITSQFTSLHTSRPLPHLGSALRSRPHLTELPGRVLIEGSNLHNPGGKDGIENEKPWQCRTTLLRGPVSAIKLGLTTVNACSWRPLRRWDDIHAWTMPGLTDMLHAERNRLLILFLRMICSDNIPTNIHNLVSESVLVAFTRSAVNPEKATGKTLGILKAMSTL